MAPLSNKRPRSSAPEPASEPAPEPVAPVDSIATTEPLEPVEHMNTDSGSSAGSEDTVIEEGACMPLELTYTDGRNDKEKDMDKSKDMSKPVKPVESMPSAELKELAKVWARKSASRSLINVGCEAQGAVVYMTNDRPVPCKAAFCGDEKREFEVISLTVLHPHSPGFGTVPYDAKKKKSDDPTKPFSELVHGTPARMRFYSFEKTKVVGNRGPRSETMFADLECGDTITFYVSRDQFDRKDMFPADMDVIPAFSVLRVVLGTRNAENAEKGSLLRVMSLRVADLGFNSLAPLLRAHLNGTKDNAEARALARRVSDECACIAKDLSDKTYCFWAAVCPGAYLTTAYANTHGGGGSGGSSGDSNNNKAAHVGAEPLFALSQWGGPEFADERPIDVTQTVLLRQTNAVPWDSTVSHLALPAGGDSSDLLERDCAWASTLLALAADLGALDVFVTVNQYFSVKGASSYMRGVPVIDTERLFKCVRAPLAEHAVLATRNTALFDTGAFHTDSDGTRRRVLLSLCDTRTPRRGASETLSPPLGDLVVCRVATPADGVCFSFVLCPGEELETDSDNHQVVLKAKLVVGGGGWGGSSSGGGGSGDSCSQGSGKRMCFGAFCE